MRFERLDALEDVAHRLRPARASLRDRRRAARRRSSHGAAWMSHASALAWLAGRWRDIVTRCALACPLHGDRVRRGALGISSAHFHESAARSLAKIGAFFHRPFSLASATTTFGSWNRKALTLSSASLCCASTSAFL